MSGGVFSGALLGLGVLLTALAVKAMDDFLDEPERTVAVAAGPSVTAYVAVCLAAAAGLAPGPVISLFLAAYAVGMAPSPWQRLPSGLPSWAESAGAVGLSALIAGPVETAGSLLLLAAIQVFDDFWDLRCDRAGGKASAGLALGRWPALALAAVFFGAAAAFSPAKALAGLAAAVGIVTAPPTEVPTEFVWLAGHGAEEGLAASRKARLRLAAVAAACCLAGALGTTAATLWRLPGPAVGTASGAGVGWTFFDGLTLAVASLAALLAAGGCVQAYRRGFFSGLARSRRAAEAARALVARADELDGTSPLLKESEPRPGS